MTVSARSPFCRAAPASVCSTFVSPVRSRKATTSCGPYVRCSSNELLHCIVVKVRASTWQTPVPFQEPHPLCSKTFACNASCLSCSASWDLPGTESQCCAAGSTAKQVQQWQQCTTAFACRLLPHSHCKHKVRHGKLVLAAQLSYTHKSSSATAT